jgi:hypothetical protein
MSTSKERVFQILRDETTDQTPAAPAYLILFLSDFERSYYIQQYRQRMQGLNRYPLTIKRIPTPKRYIIKMNQLS